jgi:hypothetical protein
MEKQRENKGFGLNSDIKKKLIENEQPRQQIIAQNKVASIPILLDLAQAGFEIEWVSDLYVKRFNYKAAIPILLKWLPLMDNKNVKEDIVRSLTVKWAKPIAAAPLIRELQNILKESDTGLAWAIGNALSIVADDCVFEEIVELVQNTQYGKAREMLAVSLGNMKNPHAEDILLDLLNDEEVAGHAIMALGRLKSKEARPAIERFLSHKKSWIRQEAKRAIGKIDKVH